MDATTAYEALTEHHRRTAFLGSTAGLLGWDQRVFMPPAAGAWRGQQLAMLTELAHQRNTDERIEGWLAACEEAGRSEADTPEAATLRRLRRDYTRATAVPERLAVELSAASSDAYGAWAEARERGDFAHFLPHLERVLALTREKAACLGTHEDPYDTCFDQYEEGMTGAAFEQLMGPVIPRLREIVARRAVDKPAVLGPGPFAAEEQGRVNWQLVQAMGFDGRRGRLDTTVHPFCTGLGPADVRLTTRFDEHDLLEGLGGTCHEMGHGLYEQGLPGEAFGLPMGRAVSLGIHESQSRLWENHVGRSEAFGRWLLPQLRSAYGERVEAIDAAEYHRRQCQVVPGRIRVGSDEASYDLHIWLRFGLERDLVRGEVAPEDLPTAWNARFEALFGFTVGDDREGCLQDVHWSAAFGYFPTYSLGNCYAAQLMVAIRDALPDLDQAIAAGDFAPLLAWLRERVHAHGRRYTPAELCRRASGGALDASHLLRHVERRYDR